MYFKFEVEEIALKINNGEIEAVLSLELKTDLLEQAQLVAELIESGELILEGTSMENTAEKNQGVKRNASTMVQGDSETEIKENSSQHKEKRISLVSFSTYIKNE